MLFQFQRLKVLGGFHQNQNLWSFDLSKSKSSNPIIQTHPNFNKSQIVIKKLTKKKEKENRNNTMIGIENSFSLKEEITGLILNKFTY